MATNRHPVDQLADVRAEIKALQVRESELRDALLEPDADLSGSEHYARVVQSTQQRLDRKLLDAKFGKPAVDQCCKQVNMVTVQLVKRNYDD